MTILECILELEMKRLRTEGKERLLSPRYFNKQQFPEKVVDLIKGLVNEIFDKQIQGAAFKFPNEKLVEQMNLINSWWSALDTKNLLEIPKKAFAQFLFSKKIINKELEVDRVLKAMIDEQIHDGTVRKTQFLKCLSRVILKAAIMNIYYYANYNYKIGDEVVPPTLKVLKFQRELLIGGLKNQEEKLGVDCRNVVKGL